MEIVPLETPGGPGRLTFSLPSPDALRAVLLLGHGAGGGIEALDLAALAALLPTAGVAVARFEQPWRVAGRRLAGPPASLDRAWQPAVDAVLARFPGVPLVVGGRSAGARVACRCFAEPARGVLALSFPLHPPGHPEKSRIDELAAVRAPVALVSGDRDPFGRPDELRAALSGHQAGPRSLTIIAGSAHSFTARKRTAEGQPSTEREIADAVTRFTLSV